MFGFSSRGGRRRRTVRRHGVRERGRGPGKQRKRDSRVQTNQVPWGWVMQIRDPTQAIGREGIRKSSRRHHESLRVARDRTQNDGGGTRRPLRATDAWADTMWHWRTGVGGRVTSR